MVLDFAVESRRRRVEAFFEGAEDDDADLSEVAERALFEQAQRFDPSLHWPDV